MTIYFWLWRRLRTRESNRLESMLDFAISELLFTRLCHLMRSLWKIKLTQLSHVRICAVTLSGHIKFMQVRVYLSWTMEMELKWRKESFSQSKHSAQLWVKAMYGVKLAAVITWKSLMPQTSRLETLRLKLYSLKSQIDLALLLSVADGLRIVSQGTRLF